MTHVYHICAGWGNMCEKQSGTVCSISRRNQSFACRGVGGRVPRAHIARPRSCLSWPRGARVSRPAPRRAHRPEPRLSPSPAR